MQRAGADRDPNQKSSLGSHRQSEVLGGSRKIEDLTLTAVPHGRSLSFQGRDSEVRRIGVVV